MTVWGERTPENLQSLLDGYRRRAITRPEYGRQQGIAISTLDYYRRTQKTTLSDNI